MNLTFFFLWWSGGLERQRDSPQGCEIADWANIRHTELHLKFLVSTIHSSGANVAVNHLIHK